MPQLNHSTHRKFFVGALSVLLFILTMGSFSASYSTYLESFKDWGTFGKVLAFGVAAGVEVAFALLMFGVSYALIGIELAIAAFGALFLLIVMAINFVTHGMMVKGVSLSAWQLEYQNWVGLVIPFLTIALLSIVSWFLFESKERRLERKIAMLSRERGLLFKEEYLNSNDLTDKLATTKPAIAAEVIRQMDLPAAPERPQLKPGFTTASAAPKDQPQRDWI